MLIQFKNDLVIYYSGRKLKLAKNKKPTLSEY